MLKANFLTVFNIYLFPKKKRKKKGKNWQLYFRSKAYCSHSLSLSSEDDKNRSHWNFFYSSSLFSSLCFWYFMLNLFWCASDKKKLLLTTCVPSSLISSFHCHCLQFNIFIQIALRCSTINKKKMFVVVIKFFFCLCFLKA